ncbi:antibiotic biosynthesis monooxygenase [Leucobacter weissii]|uniref:Antibiotic biosynthesis monooxygenase n=1 Tax=Leucobacter weissii TaxID=1983706 RepID=A0A939S604_9MICO|nr:antibiotic biosynthesis monooxygenase [Leucobacter weissii]MBO1901869.1 antibiotic biosynthesis monooxygenase [Leucobacter weissii]
MTLPVTVEVRRQTSPDQSGDAIAWIDEGLALARSFEGCLGGGVLRDAEDENVLHVVYRFRDEAALRAWENSEERLRWLRSGDPLVRGERVQRRTGIEGWFDGPDLRREVVGRTGTVRTIGVRSAPLRWKQMCAIWIGVFLMNLAVVPAVALLPGWETWPLALRAAVLAGVLAPLMIFAVMPVVTRVLRPWLRRNPGVIRSERSLREALDARAARGS